MPAGPEFSLSALRGRAIRFKTHVWALERPTSSRRVDKEHRTVYLVLLRTRSDAQLRAEVLAVRHQLRELERRVGNPAWRLVTAACSRPSAGYCLRLVCLLPSPETLLRWHRDLVRRSGRSFASALPGAVLPAILSGGR